jgi:MYXO-CTERM domain-containing protein
MSRTALALMLTVGLGISTAMAAPPGAQLVGGGGANPNATNTLTYRGGPVLAHVKVNTVYWGSNVAFSGTGTQSLDAFYTAVTQSAYYDWLIEYKTTSQPSVGRGTFGAQYMYTAGKTGSITDATIQSSLGTLIDGGKVPAPDADTLYAIHFAPGISITMSDGSASCSVFCAYHGSFNHGGKAVFYAVNPDQGGACAGGCGGDASTFNNTTSVASHELVEATTDADVGQNNLAWYNDSKGEIGDICNAQQGKVGSYVVQKEWSNSQNACIVTNPNVMVNDFSVAAAPAMLTVAAGGMTTTMLTLTKTAGMADTVKLTSTPPTGLTVSFAPTSATSDAGKSTVTVSAAPTAMAGSMLKFTINAAGTTSSHTLDVQVMVTAPPDMAMSPDLAEPAGGGSGGTGGGGSGGSGGGGTGGSGGGTGTGTGGNGNTGGGGSDSGCSIGGAASIGGVWILAALLLAGLAFRRRRA